ncbi:sensor histidine kinase, partial [Rivihabitans pingtungensis]|uniref:sensor histidine kinase n=1 Tax=Rivihabitans pingtungensis TaxID=1054498 RepID=UPI002BB1D0FA
RAAGVLAGIREFARKRARVREPHALAKLTERSLSLFRGMLAQAPAITWQCSAEAADALVLADPLQIQQVLLNLLKNACDAQQAAGREQMPIVVSLQRDGARLALAVRDHGDGLDPEAQRRLFEPFFTTKPDGLGLGLSICKTIAEAHGGELSADTPADGPGLCLWLRLPCLENPPA